MDIITSHEYLEALSHLSERVISKKYQLKKTDAAQSVFSSLEIEIDNRFKSDLGFGFSETENTTGLNRYENRIDLEYSKVTDERLIKYPIEDEITLIKTGVEITTDYLKTYEIVLTDWNKKFIKHLGLTLPTIKSLIHSPERIVLVPDETDIISNNILLTSRFQKSNQECTMFVHLSFGSAMRKKLTISTIALSYLNPQLALSPIRFFLNLIHRYGLDLTVNGRTKRFILKEKVMKKNSNELSFSFPKPRKNDNFHITGIIDPKVFYTNLIFNYGFNQKSYLPDLVKRKI